MEKQKIDIEEIIREIKEKIIMEGKKEDIIVFETVHCDLKTKDEKNFNINILNNEIDQVNKTYNIQSHRYLLSHRKVLGSSIIFCKKVIRKLIKFYVEPITNEQREFNIHVTRSLNEIKEYINHYNKDEIFTISEEKLAEIDFKLNKEVMKSLYIQESDVLKLEKENNRFKKKILELETIQDQQLKKIEELVHKITILELQHKEVEIKLGGENK